MLINTKSKIMIIWMSLLCLGLCGCIIGSPTSDNEKAAVAWREQAEENALVYIKDKYGFVPDVIDSYSYHDNTYYYYSDTLVKMSYNDKIFYVFAAGNGVGNSRSADNYQQEEICNAFLKEIENILGCEPDQLQLCLGAVPTCLGEEYYNVFMFQEYFDGNNLQTVLTESNIICVAQMIGDYDFEKLKMSVEENELFLDYNMNFLVTTHMTEDDMNKSKIFTMEKMFLDSNVWENGIYVSDAIFFEKGEIVEFNISLGSCTDFYYLCTESIVADYSFVSNPELHLSSEWNGWGAEDAVFINDDAYYKEGNSNGTLYIYYPIDKFPTPPQPYEDCPVGVAFAYKGEEGYNYRFADQCLIELDEYVVFRIDNIEKEDFSIRILYDKGR